MAALSEINEASPSGQPLVEMNAQTINKLLTALNECTEWGQVFILDSLANYSPKDDREAQSICERITPRLAHANAAVVLSAVKVIIIFNVKISLTRLLNEKWAQKALWQYWSGRWPMFSGHLKSLIILSPCTMIILKWPVIIFFIC